MSIKLIVGLGNPGSRYTATRHNAGFWLIDNLVAQMPISLRAETKFFGEVCRLDSSILMPKLNLDENLFPIWLLKPHTFMNNSGKAVAALSRFYKIPIKQILVIHDDLDFPAGMVRLKKGGSDCKHNGLKSIIAGLGSKEFLRLRFGIGHPGHRDAVSNYVLNSPSKQDKEVIEIAINDVLQVLPLILADELDKAMQFLHTSIK
ncbi:MAG: aminoacyl-tRNA hydrolase [Thiomargarita sp.]|nr:aminoacyl-tRNA hydrolase [Thiomargarita sp.]